MNARKTSRTAQDTHVTTSAPEQQHVNPTTPWCDTRCGSCKHRRLEQVSQDVVRQEIVAYLDALVQQMATRTHPTTTTVTSTSELPITSVPLVLRSVADIEAALYETYRVLRDCWCFQGNPQDAFEAARTLSPVTLHLLLTYCRHSFTEDGQYVMLRGGPEQLPWVGSVMTILRDLLLSRRQLPSPALSSSPSTATRLVMLNCRGFGWLDGTGNESYEASCRLLHRISSALDDLLYHTTSHQSSSSSSSPSGLGAAASIRRAIHTPRRHKHNNFHRIPTPNRTIQTAVLLGNAIVMDGGVPSLHLYGCAQHFLAHHEYGRGLACLVPRLRTAARVVHQAAHVTRAHVSEVNSEEEEEEEDVRVLNDNNGEVGDEAVVSPSVWANEECEEATNNNVAISPTPAQQQQQQEYSNGADSPSRSPSSMSGVSQMSLLQLIQDEAGPISCGTRVLAGVVVAQAILLSPCGPLLLHVEVGEAYSACTHMSRTQNTTTTTQAHTWQSKDCSSNSNVRPMADLASWAHALMSGDVMCDALAALEAETRHNVHMDSFTLSRLREWVEWVGELLQCPQPVVLVEWRLPPTPPQPQASHTSNLVSQPTHSSSPLLPVSFVLSLLQAYEAARQSTIPQSMSSHTVHSSSPHSSFTSITTTDVGLGSERAVQAILAMQPMPCAHDWDGVRRPMMWARGLSALLESERELQPDMVLTSLQLSSTR